jgi:hypothetical protein
VIRRKLLDLTSVRVDGRWAAERKARHVFEDVLQCQTTGYKIQNTEYNDIRKTCLQEPCLSSCLSDPHALLRRGIYSDMRTFHAPNSQAVTFSQQGLEGHHV